MNRQEANLNLLNELYKIVMDNPDLRFSQILQNWEFVIEKRNDESIPISWINEFYLESEELLKRVDKSIKEIQYNK